MDADQGRGGEEEEDKQKLIEDELKELIDQEEKESYNSFRSRLYRNFEDPSEDHIKRGSDDSSSIVMLTESESVSN